MQTKEKGKRIKTIIITSAIVLLLLISVITFVTRLIEYNEKQEKIEKLKQEINVRKSNIEELEYWLAAPMDDDYIMKFARAKLDLYRADEIITQGDQEP